MTKAVQQSIKLFQFPRMFGIPNLSPFCCKLETWLRIAGISYEIVETPDPRKGPPCWWLCPTGHSSSATSLRASTRLFSVR